MAAPDDMDLHSDDGLDFNDGDIELDLDPEPQGEPQDDDVSIKDAGPDAHADQDDFMVDHEAPVDEDTVLYDDEEQADTAFVNNAAAITAQAPVQEDEDLIDYSDEEEEPTPTYQPTSFYTPIDSHQTTEKDLDLQEESNHGSAQDETFTYDESPVFGAQEPAASRPHESPKTVQAEIDHPTESHHEAQVDQEVSDHTDGEDGGVQLQPDNEPQTDAQHVHSNDEHEEEAYESRTITVNYEGNELWLFKQHDADDSGDWLLKDMSVLQASLSDLFQACRASLGEDITHETELGLRFDHLQNMEIYEDNTACVAVSLERLFELYHTLNAQDGVNEPDSFYMCLLSRPRFAALLSDVAKHAELGSGYSGLNAAITAGETHFGDAFSVPSTEQAVGEWDNEEEQQEQHYNTQSPSSEGQEVEHAEHEEEKYEHGADNEEHSIKASPEHVNGSNYHDDASTGQIAAGHTTSNLKADHSEEFTQQDHGEDVTAQPESGSLYIAQHEQVDADTVDYSDAEDDEQPQIKAPDALSPSSATVQGDEFATGEAQTEFANGTGHGEVQYLGQNSTAEQTVQLDDAQTHVDNALDLGDTLEQYRDYTQEYNEDDPFEEFQLGTTDNYAEQPNFEGYTNQESTGYEYEDVEQQLQNDFISGADLDDTTSGDSTNATNGFTEGADFLDLDVPAEWVAEQEVQDQVPEHDAPEVFAHNEEEEDGVVELPVAATSTTADPVATSSTDLQETSPQRQKRSIDEVSDSAGDALDLTGTRWAPKSWKISFGADSTTPDMKRPRV